MKTFSITSLFAILLFTSCSGEESVSDETAEEVQKDSIEGDPYTDRYGEDIDYQPFDISFEIEKQGKDNYLVIHTDIAEGSFILSHYADPSMRGRFLITFDNNEFIKTETPLVESPGPIEEAYYWSDDEKEKKLLDKQTTKQMLNISSNKDFEVRGKVTFTVEPSCNFWRSEFSISQSSGKLDVIQGKTFQDNF